MGKQLARLLSQARWVKALLFRSMRDLGRPQGRQARRCDDVSLVVPFGVNELTAAPDRRIAVVCHIFHLSTLPAISNALSNLKRPADIYLTTDSEAKAAHLTASFRDWSRGEVKVIVRPNLGRDVAPRLYVLGLIGLSYDLVLCVHSKLSQEDPRLVVSWSDRLLTSLAGSAETIECIIVAFDELPELGLVFAQHGDHLRPWIGWAGSYARAKGLLSRLGCTLSPQQEIDFPAGSMFWARPAALAPLLRLGIKEADFDPEEGAGEGTLAHVLERLICYCVEVAGFTWIKVVPRQLIEHSETAIEIRQRADLKPFLFSKRRNLLKDSVGARSR